MELWALPCSITWPITSSKRWLWKLNISRSFPRDVPVWTHTILFGQMAFIIRRQCGCLLPQVRNSSEPFLRLHIIQPQRVSNRYKPCCRASSTAAAHSGSNSFPRCGRVQRNLSRRRPNLLMTRTICWTSFWTKMSLMPASSMESSGRQELPDRLAVPPCRGLRPQPAHGSPEPTPTTSWYEACSGLAKYLPT